MSDITPTCKPHQGSAGTYQDAGASRLVKSGTMVLPWDSVEPTCGTPLCVEPQHLITVKPRRLRYPSDECIYCGQPANTRDHLIPRTMTGEAWRTVVLTVPACKECNNLLGPAPLVTITERRAFVHAKLRKRYRSALATIELGGADLDEYGPTMRAVIRRGMAEKAIVQYRLAWPTEPDYDARYLTESGIPDPYAIGIIAPLDSAARERLSTLLGRAA